MSVQTRNLTPPPQNSTSSVPTAGSAQIGAGASAAPAQANSADTHNLEVKLGKGIEISASVKTELAEHLQAFWSRDFDKEGLYDTDPICQAASNANWTISRPKENYWEVKLSSSVYVFKLARENKIAEKDFNTLLELFKDNEDNQNIHVVKSMKFNLEINGKEHTFIAQEDLSNRSIPGVIISL